MKAEWINEMYILSIKGLTMKWYVFWGMNFQKMLVVQEKMLESCLPGRIVGELSLGNNFWWVNDKWLVGSEQVNWGSGVKSDWENDNMTWVG